LLRGCTSLADVDFSGWPTAGITSLAGAFADLGAIALPELVAYILSINYSTIANNGLDDVLLNSTLGVNDYDALLTKWATELPNGSGTIQTDSQYSNTAARAAVVAKGWTIVDGGHVAIPSSNLVLDESDVAVGTTFGVPSDWTFLHNGSGCSVYIVGGSSTINASINEVLISTSRFASGLTGLDIIIANTADAIFDDGIRAFVARGVTSSPSIEMVGANGTVPRGVHVIEYHFKVNDPSEYDALIRVDNTQVNGGDVISVSGSAPHATLTIGDYADTSSYNATLNGEVKRILIYSEKHDLATRSAIATQLMRENIPAPLIEFSADDLSAGTLNSWPTSSQSVISATLQDDVVSPTVVDDAGIKYVEFPSTASSGMTSEPVDLTPLNTTGEHTIVYWGESLENLTLYRALFSTEDPSLDFLFLHMTQSGWMQAMAGNWRNHPLGTKEGWVLGAWSLVGGGTSFLYHGGDSSIESTAETLRTFGLDRLHVSRYRNRTEGFAHKMRLLRVYDKALNVAELNLIAADLAAEDIANTTIDDVLSALEAGAISAGGTGLSDWLIMVADDFDGSEWTIRGGIAPSLTITGTLAKNESFSNGRASVVFNGDEFLQSGAIAAFDGSDKWTAISVIRTPGAEPANKGVFNLAFDGGTPSSFANDRMLTAYTSDVDNHLNVSFRAADGTWIGIGRDVPDVGGISFAVLGAGNTISHWMDGVGANGSGADAVPTTHKQLTIGSSVNGASRMKGEIAFVALMPKPINDEDARSAIEEILDRYYQLGSYESKIGLFWDFDSDVEGWTVNNATLTHESGTKSVLYTATSADPQLLSPNLLTIDGSKFYKVLMDVEHIGATTPPPQPAMYWAISGRGFSASYLDNARNSAAFSPGERRWLVYDADTPDQGGNDWITNTIVRIRLDVMAGNSGDPVFRIHSVWVVAPGAVVPGYGIVS
jgi:hypothetical protein